MSQYYSDDWLSRQAIYDRLDKLKEQIASSRQSTGQARRSQLDTLHQLEVDIGRTLLKVHAITELLVEKGVVSQQELAAKANELDGLDGARNGMLHPSLFRTDAENEAIEPDFLTALERKDLTSDPKDFLARLEEEDRK